MRIEQAENGVRFIDDTYYIFITTSEIEESQIEGLIALITAKQIQSGKVKKGKEHNEKDIEG